MPEKNLSLYNDSLRQNVLEADFYHSTIHHLFELACASTENNPKERSELFLYLRRVWNNPIRMEIEIGNLTSELKEHTHI